MAVGAKRKVRQKARTRKTKAKREPKRKRVDWSKRKAPTKGSKLRADYERSPIAKARKRAAKKGQKTRAANERAEQRRLAKRERIDAAKERLAPLLQKMVAKYRHGALESHGVGMRESREAHANWYAAKLGLSDFMPERDFMTVLEELSSEHELDELGWDIIY